MPLRLVAAFVTAGAEKLQGIADDFGNPTLDALVVGVLAGAETPLDVGRVALLEVVPSDFGGAAEENDTMPFRFRLHFPFGVSVTAGRGHGERGDRSARGLRGADFGIGPKIAEDNYAVNRRHF